MNARFQTQSSSPSSSQSIAPSSPADAEVAASPFDAFGLLPALLRGVADAGFTEPRPIQHSTIPAGLEGRDILGLAQTGTGKTAAFALPILQRIANHRCRGPRALILAPTRELAQQIDAEIRQLGRYVQLSTLCVYGGVSARNQITALNAGPDILVACPGRLLDLKQQGYIDFSRVEVLVVDEADRMFDMGFLPDLRRIIGALPPKRQNLLFSATMPREIRHLADNILQKPHVVELATSAPADTIEHALYPIEEGDKLELLRALLASPGFTSAIVFTRTKHRAKRLAQALVKHGIAAVALQGNMSQSARDRAMTGFRQKSYDVMVATDIAARGIDVEKVSHVINFDMPDVPEAYTHRIGRTGRSERTGQAYTFVTRDDGVMVRSIERTIKASIPRRRFDRELLPVPPSGAPRAIKPPPAPEPQQQQPARSGRRGRNSNNAAQTPSEGDAQRRRRGGGRGRSRPHPGNAAEQRSAQQSPGQRSSAHSDQRASAQRSDQRAPAQRSEHSSDRPQVQRPLGAGPRAAAPSTAGSGEASRRRRGGARAGSVSN